MHDLGMYDQTQNKLCNSASNQKSLIIIAKEDFTFTSCCHDLEVDSYKRISREKRYEMHKM
jgi:hypothetical protein